MEAVTSFLFHVEARRGGSRVPEGTPTPPHLPTVSTNPVSCDSPQPGLCVFPGQEQGTLVQAEPAESLCSDPLGCWGSACEPKVEKGLMPDSALLLPGPLDPTFSPSLGLLAVISLRP